MGILQNPINEQYQLFIKWIKHSKYMRLKIGLILLVLLMIFQPRFSCRYPQINLSDIPNLLVMQSTQEMKDIDMEPCSYDDTINDKTLIDIPNQSGKIALVNNIVEAGQYVPADCRPLFSTAILVPYRNRKQQLNVFLPYMHNFLQRQKIHYRIFVIEQEDTGPWNKGKLFNAGVKIVRDLGFPCVVLHDVDMLPLNPANLFACTHQPRHMSPCVDKFRYNLPYFNLIGGALAILSDQYVRVNGFSNKFEMWGGEDDDLYNRITGEELTIYRFPPEISKYAMMIHQQEPMNKDRFTLVNNNIGKYKDDGYSSLSYKRMSLSYHKLYTNITVEL